MKPLILLILLSFPVDVMAQSIMVSGSRRSFVMSGKQRASAAKPVPQTPAVVDKAVKWQEPAKPTPAVPVTPGTSVPVTPAKPVQPDNYLVMYSSPGCAPCNSWKQSELGQLRQAGVPVTIVNVDENPQYGIQSIPTFAVYDRKTRREQRRWVGYTPAQTLLGAILRAPVVAARVATQSARAVIQAPVRRMRGALPTVNTRWGRINLNTYNTNCNCSMCQGIRALQNQYRWQQTSLPVHDVGQDASSYDMIDKMLPLLELLPSDVVADLGCGDARVLIAAVQRYGCNAVGVEIDEAKADEARRNVETAGFQDRITIITDDVLNFEPQAHGVTALVTYLYEDLLAKLVDKFRSVRIAVSPYHKVPGLPMTQHGEVWVYRASV